MPEQNSQNVKAFDPATFSMPAQPSMKYSVIANATEPELSSYVQTVHIRPLGSITPGARLSDQAPTGRRTTEDMQSQRQDAQTYNYAPTTDRAIQPPIPPVTNGVSRNQQSSVQFNLSDQTTGATEARSYQPKQTRSFAPPADRSNLPYVRRTETSPTRKADSSAAFVDATNKESNRAENQNSIAKEPPFAIARTKLVDLGRGSNQTEMPQRDHNTITQKPTAFLNREAFSDKFKITPSDKRELQRDGRNGKVIYLKSVPPADRTAKLHVPKFVHQGAPETVTEPAQTEPTQPQIIRWPIVDSAQEQILFPAPVVTVSPAPMEADFASAAPANVAETTKIDFAEVSIENSTASASDRGTQTAFDPFQGAEETTEDVDSTFDPFQTTETSEATDQDSPFESTPGPPPIFDSPQKQTTPVKSSPFESSSFESAPQESSAFESASVEVSPFQSTPDQTSPFRSNLFPSPPSTLESENVGPLGSGQVNVSMKQPKSLVDSMDDFAAPTPPVPSVSVVANAQGEASQFDTSPSEQSLRAETSVGRTDFTTFASDSSNARDSPFQVVGHRRTETKDPVIFTDRFEAKASQAVKEANAEFLLPSFKPSAVVENAHQHFTATTLQSGHRLEGRSSQSFETPWLSPWWMLIGLIPILLYVGTMKLFKDEDEYHSHKAELFGSQLKFASDFGEIGRSKSDATYGRQDPVRTVGGPAAAAVRLDGGPSQSAIDFAETLEFELPLSTEVAQPACALPELRIDQSPNFSPALQMEMAQMEMAQMEMAQTEIAQTETVQPQTRRKNKKRRSKDKKRSKR